MYAADMLPRTDATPLPAAARLRGALGQLATCVQQFWWGYWQAPPGC